jgi:FkbM family methyltransferase
MWAGVYEPELVTLMKKMLKPGMTVLDLGANIGYFSVIAAALVCEQGQVHAFEPMPQNFVRLEKNLEPYPWALAHPFAVANVAGEVPIHYSDKEAGWASIHDHHDLRDLPCTSAVRAIRLDDWLQSRSISRIDFIKLDIEGSELDALLSGRRALSQFHPIIVAETKLGWHHNEICQLLRGAFYECHSFAGDSILGIPRS